MTPSTACGDGSRRSSAPGSAATTPSHAMEGIGQGHAAGAPHRDRLQPETNRHHRTAGECLKNSVSPAAECQISHPSTTLRSALRSASTRPIAGERQKQSRAQVSLVPRPKCVVAGLLGLLEPLQTGILLILGYAQRSRWCLYDPGDALDRRWQSGLSAAQVSSGSKRARARSRGRGCHAGRSRPTPCGLASCTRLQSRQLPAHAGDTGADQGVVANEPEGEADQDRRQARQPRPLCRFPNGRGRRDEEAVRRDPATDRGTAAAT